MDGGARMESESSGGARSSVERAVQRHVGAEVRCVQDHLAVEEPLEIRLGYGLPDGRQVKAISVTMRTPGRADEDFELAGGFLLTEGIVRRPEEIERTFYCGPEMGPLRLHNVVRVELRPDVALDLTRLERHFYTSSSCGVCGKRSIEAIESVGAVPVLGGQFRVAGGVIQTLPEFLRARQAVFDRTGGLHAAALFDGGGRLVALREDVGRHNALDKLIGGQFLAGRLPARERVLLVSGRASFELLQKTVMAGICVIAAVGAPSSLAVDLAERFGVTLIGFLRDERFNVYAGAERIG